MTFAPSQAMCGSQGANAIGESQLKRYGCAYSAKSVADPRYQGLTGRLNPVRRSMMPRLPLCESDHTRFGSVGSGTAHMPSPPTTRRHAELRMPSGLRLFDGPQKPLLSCSDAHTQYGLRSSNAVW